MWSLFLLVAVSGLLAAGPDGEDTPSLLQLVIVAPLAVLALWLTVGTFRQGVWSGPSGLLVRNVFRQHRASWGEIERIDPPPPYGAMRNTGLHIVLRSGKVINAALFAAGPFTRSSYADGVVDALRADLERHRST